MNLFLLLPALFPFLNHDPRVVSLTNPLARFPAVSLAFSRKNILIKTNITFTHEPFIAG